MLSVLKTEESIAELLIRFLAKLSAKLFKTAAVFLKSKLQQLCVYSTIITKKNGCINLKRADKILYTKEG